MSGNNCSVLLMQSSWAELNLDRSVSMDVAHEAAIFGGFAALKAHLPHLLSRRHQHVLNMIEKDEAHYGNAPLKRIMATSNRAVILTNKEESRNC
jgi:hypothetical protein